MDESNIYFVAADRLEDFHKSGQLETVDDFTDIIQAMHEIIGLNYANDTINAIDACWKYNPKYAKEFYEKSIWYMKEVMKNALLMTVDNSEDTIKMEVKEDDN